MKVIPDRLQCSYCIRHSLHGGECQIPNNIRQSGGGGCLGFKLDPKGCIRHDTKQVPFPLYHDIPLLGVWTSGWEIGGVDTEIKINRIRGVKWESNKGRLILIADIDYYVNEYDPRYQEAKSKPKLKVVK